jgi:hypothetical protein
MTRRRPGTFGVRNGVGPDMPTICIYGEMADGYITDKVFAYRMTWIGAYFGAWWRNRLGRLYKPFSPARQFDIEFARSKR